MPVNLTKEPNDTKMEIQLRFLCDPEDVNGSPDMDRVIVSNGTVQFILLYKHEDASKENWTIPDRAIFHAAINKLESNLLKEDSPFLIVFRWSNMWGSIGLLGLSTENMSMFCDFRRIVSALRLGTLCFKIYPREGLMREQQITLLLMDDLKTFPIELITKDLFYRNYGLAGSLAVTHVKGYKENDTTRNGASKKHWRQVRLRGDQEFMDALYTFREGHKFQLGSSFTQIRGGMRRASTELEEAQDRIEQTKRQDRRDERERRRKEKDCTEGDNEFEAELQSNARKKKKREPRTTGKE